MATLQTPLTPKVIEGFKNDLLAAIHEEGVGHLLLDFSGMTIVDPDELEALQEIMKMTSLMGTKVLYVGFRPEVVFSLVQLGVETRGMEAALNLEEAFDRLALSRAK